MNWRQKYVFYGILRCASLRGIWTNGKKIINIIQKIWIHLPFFFFFFLENEFFFFLSLILFIYLFIYLWLCWVFVSLRGLSLVVASGGHSSSRCTGLSLSRPLPLRNTGSRCTGSVTVAHGPSCSAACGILPDQGSNPHPPHWQADSQPLRHQGSPTSHSWCWFDGVSALEKAVFISGCGFHISRVRVIGATYMAGMLWELNRFKSTKQLWSL